MRIAITTDWLTSFGGGERVLEELHALYPEAPIYTSVLDRGALPEQTRDWQIRASVLRHLPMARRYSRALLPLMPAAFARLDLRAYDVVVSASSAFSKNVTVVRPAVTLCYCHTPPRYLWDLRESYTPGIWGLAAMPVAAWLRARDRAAAARVDHFVANSETVARRIAGAYGRTSQVIHPPVQLGRFTPSGRPAEDFYLVVARLVAYKRVDLAIAACNRLRRRLVVVGDGPERRRLQRLAGPTIEFAGILGDVEVAELYARCRAFLFPGCEDFGITAVEAQAAGRPVIAFGEGGATETVLSDETGVFFREQSADALVEAMQRLDRLAVDPAACVANARRFDATLFRQRMRDAIECVAGRRTGEPALVQAGA